MLTKERIAAIEKALRTKTVGIIGDFCLDVYWQADMTRSELSRETPHFPLPVVEERFAPGAGGNAAANLAALRPGKILALSVYGGDWRGALLLDELKRRGIDPSLLVKTERRFTNAYCKPLRKGISDVIYEDPRIDFDNFNPIDRETEDTVLTRLQELSGKIDVLCVADQFQYGIVTDRVREAISALAKAGLYVVIDSRCRVGDYTDCILKPNEVECWRAVYGDDGFLGASDEEFRIAADLLAKKNNATVFCTLGARGSYLTDGTDGVMTDAVPVTGELDICGAGDTSLSAFASALAAGATVKEAAQMAALASAVTVKKIGETGTASFEEILSQL